MAWKKYREDLSILMLLILFLYLVFHLNQMEPAIYKALDIHLGNIGSYNIVKLTRQFISVAFLGCVSSLALGLATGLFCFTEIGKEFRPIVEKLATVLRAFPEIAMLRFVVPLMGLGIAPTVVALTVHGVLAVIFAVLAGIDNIDPILIKTARGMGMSKWQVMVKVQLPLAFPVIISGFRVALISCIGGSTLAVSTGAEGLGVLLGAGQDTYNIVLIMECAVLICLLSLIVDKSLRQLEKHVSYQQ